MANYRIPGPVCTTKTPWSIDDGTLNLCLTPPPGPICADSSLYPSKALQCLQEKKSTEPDLGFLFRQCNNPKRGLTEEDYNAAATQLKVEVAAIKAVAEVETTGNAFDKEGRPRILFERHYFHRLTGGKYDKKNPNISNKKAGGYGKFSAQYGKLERAYQLDANAALRSASWGRFQIMGDNYQSAGFNTVKKFVLAMTQSELEHLKAFTNFVEHNKSMLKALQDKDWAGFASKYNGAGYKKNDYDTKLKAAYERFKPIKSVPGKI